MKNAHRVSHKIDINLLSDCCSKETCYPKLADKWKRSNAWLGHCAIVAAIVQKHCGGSIAYNHELNHYWNVLDDDTEVDLTRDQFPGVEDISIDGYTSREILFQTESTWYRYCDLTTLYSKRKRGVMHYSVRDNT